MDERFNPFLSFARHLPFTPIKYFSQGSFKLQTVLYALH